MVRISREKVYSLPNNQVEYLAPTGLISGVTSRPARPGEIILLYGTGFGPTNPPVPANHVFSGAAPCANPVTVTIGGQLATLQFAGLSAAGLYQLNVVVPNASSGDQAVIATVNGVPTTQNVFIAVQD